VRVSDDGKRVVVEYEADIQVIDAKSGEELMRHKGRINAGTLALSRDGKLIAFGRYDLFLWKWDAGEEPKKFARVAGFGVETSGFTPDGKTLLTVADGGRVAAFDVATGRQTGTLDLGGTPWKWSFSPDGRTLAAVYMESSKSRGGQAVVLWDPTTGKEVGRFPVGHAAASHVSWSADGSRLAAVTDYRLWAWDVKTKKPLGSTSPGHEGLVTAFAFGPDGRLYSAADDHTVRSWDPATGKPGLELVHDAWVRDVAVSPDGSLVAGSALRNDLRVWDAGSGAERFRLLGNGEMGGRRKVRFTPDGKRLVAWGDDMYLRVWDVRNGKLLSERRTLPDGATEEQLDDERRSMHLLALSAADVSADGATFALCASKLVQLFDVATGKERAKFEADPNGLYSLALSPDGRRLVGGGRSKSTETRLPDGRTQHSAAKEHRTAVWDVAAKKVVWETTSPGSWAGPVAFSPDGNRVAEAVTDGEQHAVRLWDAETGKELGRIELPSRAGHFAFDRTGRRVAVSHGDTSATLYDLETALKPAK
jgi:WD40 repeat protein